MIVKEKRFLIVGGASLIGSHLADVLLKEGAGEVVLFDNFSLGSANIVKGLSQHASVRVVKGDALKLNQVLEAAKSIDGIFMLAAYLTLPLSQSPAIGAEVNVMGLINVLEAARLLGDKKVVLASSIAVYGTNVEGLVEESTPLGSANVSPAYGAYAASKLMGEHLGRLYAQKYGLDFCAVRYSTVYGENQHTRGVNALYILEALQEVKAGRAPKIRDSGTEGHDYIHAGDAASGTLLAMVKGHSGRSYNIATGVSTSVNEIIKLVLQEFGSDLKPQYISDVRDARSTAHAELHISNKLAREELGWQPKVSIAQGISRLRKWMEVPQAG